MYHKNKRLPYFLAMLFTIFLGIVSRKVAFIPSGCGDGLYAIMVYFGVRIFFITHKLLLAVICSFIFCYSIEFLQLNQATWMVDLRHTTFGHYVLGQGFMWSDIVFYTGGVLCAFGLDLFYKNTLTV